MNTSAISTPANNAAGLLRVRYSIDRWDLIRCRLCYVTHNRFLVGLTLFCCLILAAQSAFFGSMAARPVGMRVICAVLVLIFGLVTMAIVQFVVMALQVAVQKNRGVLGEHELEIHDDGVIERTDYNESLHRWEGFYKLLSSRKFLLIYVGESLVHYVPRRAFASEQDFRSFEAQIRKRVSTVKPAGQS